MQIVLWLVVAVACVVLAVFSDRRKKEPMTIMSLDKVCSMKYARLYGALRIALEAEAYWYKVNDTPLSDISSQWIGIDGISYMLTVDRSTTEILCVSKGNGQKLIHTCSLWVDANIDAITKDLEKAAQYMYGKGVTDEMSYRRMVAGHTIH